MFSAEYLIYIIPALLLAMSIHEAMHAFAAHWLGDTTASDLGRLSLNPLRHIDLYTTIVLPVILVLLSLPPILAAKPVPFNPARVKYDEFGAALVGISGPLTNLLLAACAALPLRVFNLPVVATNFLLIFCLINVALFVFNMIPIPPLDGSRLLYAFAPEPLQRVMRQIESFGLIFIIIIFLFFLQFLGPLLIYANNAILDFLLGTSAL